MHQHQINFYKWDSWQTYASSPSLARSSKKISERGSWSHGSPCHLSSPNLAHCSANWLAAPDPSHMAPIFQLWCLTLCLLNLCPPLQPCKSLPPWRLCPSPCTRRPTQHLPPSPGTHPGPQSTVHGWQTILHLPGASLCAMSAVLCRPGRTATSIRHCASGERREKH